MPSLVSIATELLAQATELDKVLAQNNIPHTSFDNDTLEALPESARQLRFDLLDTTHNLRQLVRGARHSGLDIAFGWIEQAILRIIWQYKIASAVSIDGGSAYREISSASGLSESLVVRIIRAATNLNIFDEREPGRVFHTALSRLLATDEGYYQSVGLQIHDLGPTSLRLATAWETYGDEAGEPDQSAFSLDHGGQPLFAVLAQDPDRAQRFEAALKYSLRDDVASITGILEAFDWTEIDVHGFQLIDLGGGDGQVAQILAQHTQHITFTVQDLPRVVERGRRSLPPQLASRLSFEEQDFMQPQRPRGGPPLVYLISRCLHNWSDHHCTRILRALIPALEKGSKVLIWDMILDDRPTNRLSKKFDVQQDIIMATVSNGRDRTAAEFQQVLKMSDVRFSIERITKAKGSNHGLIQVAWDA